MKNSQKGFSVLEILVLIVIVGLIGFAGWFIYDRQQNSKQESNESTQSEQRTGNDESDTNQISYISDKTGLKFSYPKEWGEIAETDEVERCTDAVSSAEAAVSGSQFSYAFSQKSGLSLHISSADFDIKGGVVHCFTDNLRTTDFTSINTNLFADSKDIKVFGVADNCIGPVENTYINALVKTSSSTYPRVNITGLDTHQLTKQKADDLCSGAAQADKEGLTYTEELRQFIGSITVMDQ